ncbi:MULTISPECIES: hypothetical protein [unclassified Sphingomonas]|uniref:hypothetical protein n=1 Tax=unclassified Sphingomonas TaxID=196159 RepID=UPI0006F9E553|nr:MULTISPECIES: hypothetical protein [unclassified Sphingomonas]KQX20236.1 hypothetical protein ASD17_10235 [Sphingomonas sp. Root1294]KQY67486.1 hypothetical protein ASD39_10295 [Sphingomonas sp. Root50]KRB90863.1 hypothetical protein ASE22_11300 [Sphingomonas sp. Root720]
MKPTPSKKAIFALTAGAAALAAAAAFAQESLLPPGFGNQPGPTNRPQQAAPAPVQPAPGSASAAPAAAPVPALTLDPTIFASTEPEAPVVPAEELPASARRSIDMVGPFAGFGTNAWGTTDGRFLSTLMRRLDAPITSRWASITLRRALLTRVGTPANVSAPDWVAERAWLLLRMGEADGARMLVQGVDVDRFNAKLYAVAGQSALANGDAAGLCALADGGSIRSREAIWPMARAICSALSGDTAIADVMMDQARRRASDPRGIDIQLAERMMGVNGAGRRSVSVEWTGVNQLTAWRFGMASALGLTIPADLYGTVGPQVIAWSARAPMTPPAERLDAAMTAARLGVFSNSALVDLYSQAADDSDDFTGDTPGGRLRMCYVGTDDGARLSAMRGFWTGEGLGDGKRVDHYAGLILTARAAARIVPDSEHASDAADLVGSMMSAGLDRKAGSWAPVVAGMSAGKGDDAWAILAVGTPRAVVDISADRLSAVADRWSEENPQKLRLLLAALAGLDRLETEQQMRLLQEYQVGFDNRSNWGRLLLQAADRKEPATVALLVAVGMQRSSWGGLSSAMFATMIRALHDVGLDGEARMIAAEAMTRL